MVIVVARPVAMVAVVITATMGVASIIVTRLVTSPIPAMIVAVVIAAMAPVSAMVVAAFVMAMMPVLICFMPVVMLVCFVPVVMLISFVPVVMPVCFVPVVVITSCAAKDDETRQTNCHLYVTMGVRRAARQRRDSQRSCRSYLNSEKTSESCMQSHLAASHKFKLERTVAEIASKRLVGQ